MNDSNRSSYITNLALAYENDNIDIKNYSDDLFKYQDQIFNFRKLSNNITNYGIKCIKTMTNFKCFNDSQNCFQVLAMDYLPVNHNDLKILEVNKGPGFKALKINFNITDIFDELFKITLDNNSDGLKYFDKID